MSQIESLKKMAGRMRLAALEMAIGAGRNGAHLGPAMSSMEIMAVLYGRILRLDPDDPCSLERDRFIASKAHCVLAHYAALAEAGFLTKDDLATFEKNGTHLAGHPSMNLKCGLEYSGGSLGMALGVGIGAALESKRKDRRNRIFVLLGDGELNEGSNWEGFMSAAHFKLDNLTAIVDKNSLQYDGPTEDIMALGDLKAKLRSFGWNVEVIDGHDVEDILQSLEKENRDRPLAVIAHTIKGKGVSFMENVREWHHSALSQAQYEQAVAEVKEAASL